MGCCVLQGGSGEVVIQGPKVIDGSENNPEANATSFTDGWFRTGDLGTLNLQTLYACTTLLDRALRSAG